MGLLIFLRARAQSSREMTYSTTHHAGHPKTSADIFLLDVRAHRKKGHILWPVNYADNLFLPFARLAAKTFLPPGVLILALKPCTLLLCLFFGWNVIFIFKTPPFNASPNKCHIPNTRMDLPLKSHDRHLHKGQNILRYLAISVPSIRKYHDDYIP